LWRNPRADEAFGREQLEEGATEGLGEFLRVVQGQEEEAAVVGEASFQHKGMPVGVGPQEIAEGLKCHDGGAPQGGGTCGQAAKSGEQGEDQRGDGIEVPLIVTEEDAQGLGGRKMIFALKELGSMAD
jgi:hypothetical protein